MSKYLIVALVVMGSLFAAYFKLTQSKIEALNGEVQTLQIADEQNQSTINTLQVTAEKNEQRNKELQANLAKTEASLDTLRRTLQEHNLTRLALKKPALIEDRMQGATDDLFENYFSSDYADVTE